MSFTVLGSRASRRLLSCRTVPIRTYSSSTEAHYEYLLTSRKHGVGQITINRPKKLNALCTPLFEELNKALREYDVDESIGAIVLTGNEKAFAGKRLTL
jgi:enoyl-CoA hydratase